MPEARFVDIHCHLIPGIDDGASDWKDTIAMARMAVDDGFDTIICTPHQCGNFARNSGALIRSAVEQVQQALQQAGIPLRVLPGADVRIEADMVPKLKSGELLTLGDQRRHVLLELPHELYMPLEPVIQQLTQANMVGILSHPERNQGILARPQLIAPLVQAGCLMQVTAGSLMGTFGPHSQQLAEWLLDEGLVHFLATDAHGSKKRRPLMRRAFDVVSHRCGPEMAQRLCCDNPRQVVQGREVAATVMPQRSSARKGWFGRRKAS